MRDYNTIQFRLPRRTGKADQQFHQQKQQPPLASSSSSIAAEESANSFKATSSVSTQESLPEQESSSPPHSPSPVAFPISTTKYQQQSYVSKIPAANSLSNNAVGVYRNTIVSPPSKDTSISKLRNALQETGFTSPNPGEETDGFASPTVTGVKKSDNFILELRSNIRTLRRQLDKTIEEKEKIEAEYGNVVHELQLLKSTRSSSSDLSPSSSEVKVTELKLQVDSLTSQLLTADMVRKELEDTLEAEQYTWELRNQDQFRAIDLLRDECATLSEDLNACRVQWKEAEEVFSQETSDLKEQLERTRAESSHWKRMQDGGDLQELKSRLLELDQERSELQSCLDEALKELEAVDAELQGNDSLRQENERLSQELELARQMTSRNLSIEATDAGLLESLNNLYLWMLERYGNVDADAYVSPRDARGILAAIQTIMEQHIPSGDVHAIDFSAMEKQIVELNSQISVYRDDLKSREENSAELRASLKEAVSLLKPLQDAVAKTDQEKIRLHNKLNDLKKVSTADVVNTTLIKDLKDELIVKQQEIDGHQAKIQNLEIELSRARLSAASGLVAASRTLTPDYSEVNSTPDSLNRTREDLKAKRATEKTLKQLLKDAQARFQTLHEQNQEIEAMNSELQERLKDAEENIEIKPSLDSDVAVSVQRQLSLKDTKVEELESSLEKMKNELEAKDTDMQSMSQEIENLKSLVSAHNQEHQLLTSLQEDLREMEAKFSITQEELNSKKASEKTLKKSLKEALSLLYPLQMHLEEAESEKKELILELRKLRKISDENSNMFGHSMDVSPVRELQATVRLLELENSQLHDALEELSQSINVSHVSGVKDTKHDSTLQEEIVELKSRNEVAQKQLDTAKRDKRVLTEALYKRETGESGNSDEMTGLRERLRKAEADLENAKFIATSALVKVEVLSSAHGEEPLLNNSTYESDDIYQEKALLLEREMETVRNQSPLSKSHYRLTCSR